MITNAIMTNSPVRTIKAKVELYNGSTLVNTFSYTDALISYDIERVGEESKFFGFGVCQKANIKLRDIEGAIKVSTANSFKIYITSTDEYITPFPEFYVTEVHRDENTNALSITAYDALERAAAHTVGEITAISYTVWQFMLLAAEALGLADIKLVGLARDDALLETYYPSTANFEGSEDIRTALNAAAEMAQAIYFIDNENNLVIKRLDKDGAPALTISKEDYFTLESKTNRRLTTIYRTTELGDDIFVTTGESGTTIYLRDNPFLNLREDAASILEIMLANMGGFTINQFSCSWRGNYLLEIGDKIALETKEGDTVYSYVLNDAVKYDGSLHQQTQWNYTESKTESSNNPATLGEALNQTFAKVDKVNKQIEIVASESAANTDAIAALQINTGSISASVEKIEKETSDSLNNINENMAELSSKVNATITAEEVSIEVSRQLAENGAAKVITTTGTFDERGLTVEKDGSAITTTISENGMAVNNDGDEVLTANNEGVKAVDLHATTFLIIGNNSRFEDYGSNRTACFWIGG